MPTFDTPDPITLDLELGVGDVLITAGDRADTTVEVRPSDAAEESDVDAARRVRVDLAGGVLRVSGPKIRAFDFSRKSRSVEVVVELPSGSTVAAEAQMANIRATGRLGQCRVKTSMGNVALERTGALRLDTSTGHVTVGAVAGDAEVATGSGAVRIGSVDGAVVVRNSNGGTEIGTAAGDVRVRSANGDIRVERARAAVDAKSSNGSVRVAEVARGSVVLETAMGDLEVGIAAGTAAWLQVDTGFGQVRNLMDDADRPAASDETVEVRGRTSYGDITIRRA
ncbi:DUF4097 family beta strand repeat-containing protein [Actinokineospora bangkokensis]|uniref:DUF4097 domain-containing protein n=1 Tax=Actinokineospora bangkokensis TaxID=1193682 RepID=A0A1Q9LMP3_9PSEU|nr:DUF4097 family beta strand repeat-containing protein [Actinokineospora bangkokensis]OLR93285.1 hypothetical protein BJP25_17540 [Actinokineospora bangkokensis]